MDDSSYMILWRFGMRSVSEEEHIRTFAERFLILDMKFLYHQC